MGILERLIPKKSNMVDIESQNRAAIQETILSHPYSTADEQQVIEDRKILLYLTQWQQDRTPQHRKLFEQLAGYLYDKERRELIRNKWDEPYCTLVGAYKLVNFIEPIDHNVMLANWSEKELKLNMKINICHPLLNFMCMNKEELGLDLEHMEYVFWTIVNSVEATYWRGWNDGERRKDREIHKVNEIRNMNQPKEKKSLFGIGG